MMLNISFLEMRKAEKNYFLYQDLRFLEGVTANRQKRYEVLQVYPRLPGSQGCMTRIQRIYELILHNLKPIYGIGSVSS